jgi:hypothetical protein
MFNDLLLILPVAGRPDCSVPAPRRGSKLNGNGMLVKFGILDPDLKMFNRAIDLHTVSGTLMGGSVLKLFSCPPGEVHRSLVYVPRGNARKEQR